MSTLAAIALLPLLTLTLVAQVPALFGVGGIAQTPYADCGVATPDGGYLVCFTMWDMPPLMNTMSLGVAKIFPDGRIEWSRMLQVDDGMHGWSEGYLDGLEPIGIVRTGDGNVMIGVHFIDPWGDHLRQWGVGLLILDPQGRLISYRNYSATFRTAHHEVDETEDAYGFFDGVLLDIVPTDVGAALLIESDDRLHIAQVDGFGSLLSSVLVRQEEDVDSWMPPMMRADSAGGFYICVPDEVVEMCVPDKINYQPEAWIDITHIRADNTVRRARLTSTHGTVRVEGSLTLSNGHLLLYGEENRPDPPSDTASPYFKWTKTYWVVDPTLATATTVNLPGLVGSIKQAALLSTGEVLLLHAKAKDFEEPFERETGAILLTPEGRFLSQTSLGVQPARESREQEEWDETDTTARMPQGVLDIHEVVPGFDRSLLIAGLDENDTPYYAFHIVDLPFPCADEAKSSVDTTSTRIALQPLTSSIETFVPDPPTRERSLLLEQYDIPFSLTSACSFLPAPESSAIRGDVDNDFSLQLMNELVRLGQPIGLTYRLPAGSEGAVTLRVVETGSGEMIVNRLLATSGAAIGSGEIPTSGWRAGVYVVSLEIERMRQVAKVVVQP